MYRHARCTFEVMGVSRVDSASVVLHQNLWGSSLLDVEGSNRMMCKSG
jgi:hypothetical protein